MKFRYCVADDAHFFRELIKQVLKSTGGVCVGEAVDGQETIEMVKFQKPDLLILDLVMPIRSGLDVLKEIRSFNPHMKILICSTVDMDQYINKAYELGCTHYLTKPFKRDVLLNLIDELFDTHKEVINE